MKTEKSKEKEKKERGERKSKWDIESLPLPLSFFFFSLFLQFSHFSFRTISDLKEREACSKSTVTVPILDFDIL